MLTLYGAQGSGSAAIEAALELAGLRHRFVEAASWIDGPGWDELARVNPLGQVPTLVLDDGSVLTESAAILIHLGMAHPFSGLLPSAPAQRAQAVRGLVYIAANCYAAIGVIDYPERIVADADEALKKRIVAGAKRRLHGLWDEFADSFMRPGERFLGGGTPGALDLLAAVVSKWSGTRPHVQASRPEFFALLQRIEQHPRLAALFERHWPSAK